MRPRFAPGDRVVVWIVHSPYEDDIQEGDGGTVIQVKRGYEIHKDGAYYVDVILDTGVRLGHHHERTFKHEHEYDPSIPF